jgi:sigma-B regulation protein RsbU (phosphoserine phosphatase)
MFVTCFYGVLDTRSGTVEFSNAGHNPPLVLRRDGRVETTPLVGGFFLGAFGNTSYERATLTLEPGDTLVVFTDGISEAATVAGDQFGEDRIAVELAPLAGLEVDEIIARLSATVDGFADGAPQADDMTLLALAWGAGGR